MQVVRTIESLRACLPGGRRIALTPTMGGLHEGHLSLVRRGREWGDVNVASLYVNPLQFGENEDFAAYPRRFARDCEKLAGLADIVFAPDDAQMYPQPQTVRIALPPLADELCGRTRPGFFHGVATAVVKLLNIVRPGAAIFGQKDYQQARLMQSLARQLNFAAEIILMPTVRESDGLAMSSRNEYLSPAERRRAPRLYAVLTAATKSLRGGRDAAAVCKNAREELTAAGFAVEYFELRDAETLRATADNASAVLLAAASLGDVRLIDNMEIPRGF